MLPARSAALLDRMAVAATAKRHTVRQEGLDQRGRVGIGLHMPATHACPGNFAVAGNKQLICAVEGRALNDRLASPIQVDMMRLMYPLLLRGPHNASMMRLPASGWRLRCGKRLDAGRRTVGRRPAF
jgi:hypothetical protein